MVKHFNEDPTFALRGLQIWLILIGKASNRQTLTYGQLSELLGFEGAGTLAGMLGHVVYYCQQNDLPPLTALVVNQNSGRPGEGYPGTDPDLDREAIFSFDWYGIYPPTVDELSKAYHSAQ